MAPSGPPRTLQSRRSRPSTVEFPCTFGHSPRLRRSLTTELDWVVSGVRLRDRPRCPPPSPPQALRLRLRRGPRRPGSGRTTGEPGVTGREVVTRQFLVSRLGRLAGLLTGGSLCRKGSRSGSREEPTRLVRGFTAGDRLGIPDVLGVAPLAVLPRGEMGNHGQSHGADDAGPRLVPLGLVLRLLGEGGGLAVLGRGVIHAHTLYRTHPSPARRSPDLARSSSGAT